MTDKDLQAKSKYIKDLDRIYAKYLNKSTKARCNSWEFRGAQFVRQRINELKRELKELTI